jgi:predicted SAM-dependent methyltransferase
VRFMHFLNFSETRFSLDRGLFSYQKVQELTGTLIRGRRMFVRSPRAPYLNLGCGPNISAAFTNLDWTWRPGIDICWDLNRGVPVPPQSMTGCFTEHCLEHLDFEVALATLREIFRVLKSGGTARIVVPDPEIYIDEYVKHRNGEPTAIPLVTPELEPTPMMSLNRVFRQFGHKFAWDFETLELFLRRTGFVGIRRQTFRNGRDPVLLIDTPERRVESLYVEAVKP